MNNTKQAIKNSKFVYYVDGRDYVIVKNKFGNCLTINNVEMEYFLDKIFGCYSNSSVLRISKSEWEEINGN